MQKPLNKQSHKKNAIQKERVSYTLTTQEMQTYEK